MISLGNTKELYCIMSGDNGQQKWLHDGDSNKPLIFSDYRNATEVAKTLNQSDGPRLGVYRVGFQYLETPLTPTEEALQMLEKSRTLETTTVGVKSTVLDYRDFTNALPLFDDIQHNNPVSGSAISYHQKASHPVVIKFATVDDAIKYIEGAKERFPYCEFIFVDPDQSV